MQKTIKRGGLIPPLVKSFGILSRALRHLVGIASVAAFGITVDLWANSHPNVLVMYVLMFLCVLIGVLAGYMYVLVAHMEARFNEIMEDYYAK